MRWTSRREKVHAYHLVGLIEEVKPEVQIRSRGSREFGIFLVPRASFKKAPDPVKEIAGVWNDHCGVLELSDDGFQFIEGDFSLVDNGLDVKGPCLMLVPWEANAQRTGADTPTKKSALVAWASFSL
jgi:hypothetical protein